MIILYANIKPILSFFLELYKQKLAYCILEKKKCDNIIFNIINITCYISIYTIYYLL